MSRSAGRLPTLRRARFALAAIGGLLLAAGTAPAALAAPGVPDPPTPLFVENFENGTGAPVISVTSYSGAEVEGSNPTYQTDEPWAPAFEFCNGLVVSFAGAGTSCGEPANTRVKAVARKVGTVGGDPTPDDNHAVVENRAFNPGADEDESELRIAEGVTLPGAPGRFLIGGTDIALFDCAVGAPLFSFFMSYQDPENPGQIHVPLSPEPQDTCAQSVDVGDGMHGGRIYSDASVLSTFSDLALDIQNANEGIGSYHALDNFLVADATPVLDVTGDTVPAGSTATLTFTITNTSDLASKQGWSFAGEIPSGLQVVSGGTEALPRLTRATSCPSTTVHAPAGGSAVTASGSLAIGQTSCTVTLGVTAAGTGSFAVNGAGFTRIGLRAPGNANVTFTAPVVPPPPPPPPQPPPPAATPIGVTPTPLAQCAAGALQLTDVFGHNGRTLLRGVAGPDGVGKVVAIHSLWNGKRVATATVQRDLSFTTTAPLPPRAIRDTNTARFQARLGAKRSRSMKFARRMTETVASRLAATRVNIGGRVTKPFALPRASIVVRGAQSCQSDESFRGVVVASKVRVKANGTWSATIALPTALQGDKVYLRAQTKVRRNTKNPKTFATFTLIQGVALK